MAIIYTYPTKATLALADLTLISDSADANKTKQATMASIKDVIDVVDSAASGSGISITGEGSGPYTGAITIANTGVLSFSNAFGTYITGTTNTSATGNASIGTLDLSAIDGVDTSNRFLSKDNVWSTVIGVVGPGTVNKIPKFATTTTLGDSIMAEQAAAGVFASSYIEISGSGGLSTQDLEINAALWDGSASKGTVGQLLSSSGTETSWIEPPAASTQGKIQYNNLANLAGSTNMTFTDSGVTALFQVRNIVQVRAGNGNAGTIKLWSGDDVKHVDLLGPITGVDDYAIRMPASLGTANQVLKLPSTIPAFGASQLVWGDATGAGGGISFSGATVSGIATFASTSSATVNPEVKLLANGQMTFDGSSGNAGIKYDSGTSTLRVGDIVGNSGIVALYSDGAAKITVSDSDVTVVDTTQFNSGLKFGASGELLNSYEEGTWTPVMFQSSSPSVTATGYYIKIGKKVTAFFSLVCTAGGSAEISIARISGLPFNAFTGNGYKAGVSIAENTANAAAQKFIAGGPGGATTLDLKVFTSGTDYQYTPGKWPNSQGNFTVSGSYTYHAQS